MKNQLRLARTFAAVVGVSSVSCASPAKAPTSSSPVAVILRESDFLDTDWSSTPLAGSTATVKAIQTHEESGNKFRRVQFLLQPGATQVAAFHSSGTLTFNPRLQGAIESLTFGIDTRIVVGHGLGQGFWPAIRQGGKVFVGPAQWQVTNLPPSFETKSVGPLAPADFGAFSSIASGPAADGSVQPDLSRSGGPVDFGFVTWEFQTPTEITADYDNLVWTLQTTPHAD